MMRTRGIIFDLDGTLTRPYLDFDRIRAEIGTITGPILEALEEMSEAEKRRAWEILERYELEAAENSELNPGAAELYAWLRKQKFGIALATRNSRINVEHFCRKHDLYFDSVITREDGPTKPDPFGVVENCKKMGILPKESIMVGDYLFDVQCGRNAGARTVLLRGNKDDEAFVHEADHVIEHLGDLKHLL